VAQSSRFRRSIEESESGEKLEDVGLAAFVGAPEAERVFVEIQKVVYGIMGLGISSEGAFEEPLVGYLLLSPVVSDTLEEFGRHTF